MPTYEYYCESCKHTTELFTSISNRPDSISCEQCGFSARYSIAPTAFKVKGANAANNYSGSDNFKWFKPEGQ